MKQLNQLTLEQQDILLSSYRDLKTFVNTNTHERYVVFMGEQVDLESIKGTKILLG